MSGERAGRFGEPLPLGANGTLEAAAAALRRGEPVGLPTDTVYGLAALAGHPEACRRLFQLKGRPATVALPVLVASLDQATGLAAPEERAQLERLAGALWPGPLTLVVRRSPASRLELGGDPDSVGIRCPAEPFVRQLAARVGPLATTSANPHGSAPLHDAAALAEGFPGLLVVDGGRRAGLPSSVVSLLGPAPQLLREGPVGLGEVLRLLAPPPG